MKSFRPKDGGGNPPDKGHSGEPEAALGLVDRHRPGQGRITPGGEKGFDVIGLVEDLRARNVTAHIAIDGHVRGSGTPRRTAIDQHTTRHPDDAVSQAVRKRIEEIFGWTKTTAGLAQVKVRGLAKVRAAFTFGLAAYNLARLPKLLAATG